MIVGLGNPGPRYARTRHNVGRRLIEHCALQFKVNWKEDHGTKSHCAKVHWEGISLLLAVPDLFMNESGEAVRLLVRRFEIDFRSDLLVVVDDVALPLGRLRLRPRGSDGGQRGLRSVEKNLGSQDYARLRIGIAPSRPLKVPLEKYVLSSFEKREEEKLKSILCQAEEACRLWVTTSMEKAMDGANKPPRG